MRFWDSSALVPLLVLEDVSEAARRSLGEDSAVFVGGEVVCNACRPSPAANAKER
ncbi:MAG TPA: hypothetical protein VNF73_12775 [Candidatus Saccharimonadales bacterium]|nr:hypothetical protein [Candidatus Saccharimonadales bacterium]